MIDKPILHIVHCVDTEGPLNETLDATFERLYSIFGVKLQPTKENLQLLQSKKIDLVGKEDSIAKCFAPELLKYNRNWNDVEKMVDDLLSSNFRRKYIDDFNGGLVYSWHCMDHVGHTDNPRHKDIGYGNIFRFYKSKLREHQCKKDELNWHFHPLSLTRKAVAAATSYNNNLDLLTQILCRRILDEEWFPVVNRPGFHSERPDSHMFLEQWIPFDYANQSCEVEGDQPDMSRGRFGDWRRAPKTWRGYHPSHDDYQSEGNCRRLIFRCLNVGTRARTLTQHHIREAFREAESYGGAILSFADHDYRDMRLDIHHFQDTLKSVRQEFNNVLIKYSGAEEAVVSLFNWEKKDKIKLSANIKDNVLNVELVSGEMFGPQPYLAIKTKEGQYYHDNFDIGEFGKRWTYVFDENTLLLESISKVGVGTAGKYGKYSVVTIEI